MAYDSRVYRVLIASPSDVGEEREEAVRVIQDWNDLNSASRQIVILPLRWETHSVPEYNVRPQEAINRRIVDDCDFVVGVFWTKLGTPTGEADSGTLEEIERVAKAGKPAMLYFSHVPLDPNQISSSEFERLRAFKDKIRPNALIEKFVSGRDFRDKFAKALDRTIMDFQKREAGGLPSPLKLHFISLENGELKGSSTTSEVARIELSDPETVIEEKYQPVFRLVLEDTRLHYSVVPVLLGLENVGAYGVRNLFIEMSITSSPDGVIVSHSNPTRIAWSIQGHGIRTNILAYNNEPTDVERLWERLLNKVVVKDGQDWKYSLEWDALQPGRICYMEPIYLLALHDCQVTVSAKVYADSFATPLVLNAQVNITSKPSPVDSETVLSLAKQRYDSQNILFGKSSESSISSISSSSLSSIAGGLSSDIGNS